MNTEFALYYDEALTQLSPYHTGREYLRKAVDRMDRSFSIIKDQMPSASILDIGASPFYLLDCALAAGATRAEGIYFANDTHPLRNNPAVFSKNGKIGLHHLDVEKDQLPFAENAFDVVTACEILEHLEYFPSLLGNEIHRILRPGGHLMITVPNVGSLGNILKLIVGGNIYMRYRADPTGRHKHEYTINQLRVLVRYFGLELLTAGYLPSSMSGNPGLRALYRALAKVPFLRRFCPVLFVLARMPEAKTAGPLGDPPTELYSDHRSIEA